MALKVLALAGSPRRGGNTGLLLEQALAGVASCGIAAEKLVLDELNIHPCRHCDGCVETGKCVIDDDMQLVHSKLRAADRLILASPIFFMGMPAQAKAAIDRCQALWVERYVLKIRRPVGSDGSWRRGLFLSVGGMRLPNLFEPIKATVKAFFAACDIAYGEELLYPGIDEAGTVVEHPAALEEAYAAGARLVQSAG